MMSKSLLASLVLVSLSSMSHGLPAAITAPPEVAAQCPSPPGPVPLLLSNPVDCSSFYMCDWYGTAVLQQCPPVLHFNAQLQVCDSPYHANCILKTTPVPPITPVQGSSGIPPAPGPNATPAKPPVTGTVVPINTNVPLASDLPRTTHLSVSN